MATTTDGGTWYYWATTSNTTTTTDDSVWYEWRTSSTSTDTYAPIWSGWVDYATNEPRRVNQQVYHTPPIRNDYEKIKKEKALSEEKACELLGDIIGKNQLEIYKRSKRLLVEGKRNKFIINGGESGYRLKRIDEKKKLIEELCIHLENQYKFPITDNVVAILLSLMNNEKEVIELANNHGANPYVQLPEAAQITLH